LPTIRQVDSPRGWFNESEYRALVRKAHSFAKEEEGKGNLPEADRWLNMADFIIFMVGSFLRSSEWASLQRKHIECEFRPRAYLRIAVIKGKTKMRYTTSLPEAANAFRRMCRRTGGALAHHACQFLLQYFVEKIDDLGLCDIRHGNLLLVSPPPKHDTLQSRQIPYITFAAAGDPVSTLTPLIPCHIFRTKLQASRTAGPSAMTDD